MKHCVQTMVFVVVGAASASCAGPPSSDDVASESATSKIYQELLVEGVTPVEGRVLESAHVQILPQQGFGPSIPHFADDPSPPTASAGAQHFTVEHIDVASGVRSRIRFDPSELQQLSDDLAGSGISEPVLGQVTDDGAERIEKGLSNAIDSRQNVTALTGAEYIRVGRVLQAAACTGTLVGRRLVITAAHCILDENDNYVAGTFTADAGPSSAPYGTQNVVSAWWGGNFAGCTDWATCVPEDWAILLLQDSFPSGHPGWAGYAYGSQSKYTSTWNNKRQHGYAGCGIVNSPSPCTEGALYGQPTNCTIGDFRFPFSGGYNSTFSHGCDSSAGHSGGSVYERNYGLVLGVSSTEMCFTCTVQDEPDAATRANPNLAKRLDSFIVNLLNNLRATYP